MSAVTIVWASYQWVMFENNEKTSAFSIVWRVKELVILFETAEQNASALTTTIQSPVHLFRGFFWDICCQFWDLSPRPRNKSTFTTLNYSYRRPLHEARETHSLSQLHILTLSLHIPQAHLLYYLYPKHAPFPPLPPP
jgi:hypothetical protein